jgi:hypothetical protein
MLLCTMLRMTFALCTDLSSARWAQPGTIVFSLGEKFYLLPTGEIGTHAPVRSLLEYRWAKVFSPS